MARDSTSALDLNPSLYHRRHRRCPVLTCGVGVWADHCEISGALIAPGTIVVESNIKKVQHPTGGVVGELLVRDGDRVKAGDLLVRLDDTVTRANLAIVTKTLTELTPARRGSRPSEIGSQTIKFPDDLTRQADVPEIAQVLAAETKLFDLRRSARAGQKSQLQERINQANEEIVGFGCAKRRRKKRKSLLSSTSLPASANSFRRILFRSPG